jgi:excisionase family DNA binding protein
VVTRSEKSRPEPGTEHTALYLTPAQAAELLQVSEKTITRWSLVDASMPVIRRGRVVRFHRGRLLDWLQRQEPRAARCTSTRTAHGGSDAA